MSSPAAEARAKVKAAHPEAVVVERGRNSIKHRLADAPDGRQRFALDCAIGPLHYGPAEDQEIDTAFVPSVAPWDWEMTKAGFEVRALSRLDAGQVIEYRDGDQWVRFQPMALQYGNDLDQIQPIAMPGNVKAAVDDDTLTWADGYGPGRALSWQAQTTRLAKRLTIGAPTDLPPVEQYILDGGGPVLELNLIFAFSGGVTPYINGQPWGKGSQTKDKDTQELVEFRDDQGNILWWFNLPRSWDSSGDPETGGQLGTLRFKKVGNALYVSHRVPLDFVRGATYPLIVDVDVDKQVSVGGDDGKRWGAAGFDATATLAYVGRAGATEYHTFARWTGVTLAGTIDVSYVEVFAGVSAAGTPERNVYGVDEDNPAAPTTSGEFDAEPLTAAVVPWDGAWTNETWEQSPSLNAIFQELVDTYTISNEAVMVQVKNDKAPNGNNYHDLRQYEFAGNAHGPKLHIEYSVGIGADEMMAAIGQQTGGGGGSGDIMAHHRKPPEAVAY